MAGQKISLLHLAAHCLMFLIAMTVHYMQFGQKMQIIMEIQITVETQTIMEAQITVETQITVEAQIIMEV